MLKEPLQAMTCIQCPRGCRILVTLNEKGSVETVEGQACEKGELWARKEIEGPERTLTSSVRVLRGREDLVSVRTSGAIPRRLLDEAMAVVKELRIEAPVKLGRVVAENLAGTGVSLVATRAVERVSAVR